MKLCRLFTILLVLSWGFNCYSSATESALFDDETGSELQWNLYETEKYSFSYPSYYNLSDNPYRVNITLKTNKDGIHDSFYENISFTAQPSLSKEDYLQKSIVEVKNLWNANLQHEDIEVNGLKGYKFRYSFPIQNKFNVTVLQYAIFNRKIVYLFTLISEESTFERYADDALTIFNSFKLKNIQEDQWKEIATEYCKFSYPLSFDFVIAPNLKNSLFTLINNSSTEEESQHIENLALSSTKFEGKANKKSKKAAYEQTMEVLKSVGEVTFNEIKHNGMEIGEFSIIRDNNKQYGHIYIKDKLMYILIFTTDKSKFEEKQELIKKLFDSFVLLD